MTLLTSTPGMVGVLPPAYGALITGPLTSEALAFDARVATTITTGAKEFRAPRVVSDAAASWTAEGEEISPSDPTLDEVVVAPSKVAGLVPITRELAEDSSPSAQEIVGQSLARALVEKVDQAFLTSLPAPAAQGLAAISPTEVEGSLENLDAIHDAKAAAANVGATPTAVLVNPSDALALAKVKDENGSNRDLLADTTTLAGIPVIASRFIAQGEIWLVDSSQILTILREDTTLAVSSDVYFSSDRIAVRATVRVGFGVVDPARIVRITVEA